MRGQGVLYFLAVVAFVFCCIVQVVNYWSERRCADGFVESAVGHYFGPSEVRATSGAT
jgi:hypothetical protein